MLRLVKFLFQHPIYILAQILFYYINILIPYDLQGFAEKLFSRLKNCNERFEVRTLVNLKKHSNRCITLRLALPFKSSCAFSEIHIDLVL